MTNFINIKRVLANQENKDQNALANGQTKREIHRKKYQWP